MEQLYLGMGAGVLLAIAGTKRVLKDRAIIQRHQFKIDAFVYVSCMLLLGFYFYAHHIMTGVVMSGLGSAAILKYLRDKSKGE